MNWIVDYIPEARKDFESLDGSQRIVVRKAIKKIQANPLPRDEGGYGVPLGNHLGMNLTGLLKVKLKKDGIRIVYKLIRTKACIRIIVIGARKDDIVYKIADKRK